MWISSLVYRKKETEESTQVGRPIQKCPPDFLSSKEKILQSSWSPEFPFLRRQEEEDKKGPNFTKKFIALTFEKLLGFFLFCFVLFNFFFFDVYHF